MFGRQCPLATFAPMFARHVVLLILLVGFAMPPFSGYAQTRRSKLKRIPTTVLVQLRTENNRRDALIHDKKYEDLETLKKDTYGAMNATVLDFRDHFNACQVYYFMDSNFEQIMARKFENVLLDENLQSVAAPIVEDSNYLIVHYGYPTWQTKKGRWDTTKQKDWGGHPNGRALVINDHSMRQIHYIYNLDYDFFNFRRKFVKNPYRYESKKFDIEYNPSAAELNRNFLYSKHRRKNK